MFSGKRLNSSSIRCSTVKSSVFPHARVRIRRGICAENRGYPSQPALLHNYPRMYVSSRSRYRRYRKLSVNTAKRSSRSRSRSLNACQTAVERDRAAWTSNSPDPRLSLEPAYLLLRPRTALPNVSYARTCHPNATQGGESRRWTFFHHPRITVQRTVEPRNRLILEKSLPRVDGPLPGMVAASPFLSSIRVLFTVGGGQKTKTRERERHEDSRRTTRRASGYFFSRVIGVQASLCNWYRCVLAVISLRSISRRLREPFGSNGSLPMTLGPASR